MNRQAFGLLAVGVLASTASAVTFHSGVKFGGTVSDPNTFQVESWDFGLNMEDPDTWLTSSLQASIAAPFVGLYSFEPRNADLQPPTNPVSDFEQYSTFFSTAREYPNTLVPGDDPTYITDVLTSNRNEINAMWSAGSAADGVGPAFTMFRLSFTFESDMPGLTLTPGPASELVATVTGTSTTSFDGEVPFSFDFYTVPEPTTLMLLGGGLLLITRRRR